MAGLVPPNIEVEIDSVLADGDLGILAKWKLIEKRLLDSNVAFKATLRCNTLAVHPMNRGGSGCHAFNMHEKGAKIIKCGASMEHLTSCVCFEFSPSQDKRGQQIAFNQKLVEASNGLMAPLSHSERAMSVSGTHTSQFMKALVAGCKTPQKELQDPNGNLCLEQLASKDEVLKLMATQGWEWTVVPWHVEAKWPSLPTLAADALNSVNSIFEAQGELELALTIAASATGEHVDFDALSKASCTSSYIAPYCHVIGKFVQKHGGGKDKSYPLVSFVNDFQKHFGSSCMVGKDFFVHLVGIEFVPTNMTTFLKVALLATQITCPESKRVDGFSRMLVKGDLDRLKAKKSRGQVLEAEEFLTKKWTDVNAADLNTINKCKAFGRCCLRILLHLLQKEKIGREGKEYANLEAIGEACDHDIAHAGGMLCLAPAVSANQEPQPQPQSAVSLDQSHTPMFNVGLKIELATGKTYCHKDFPNTLFDLLKVESESASLCSHDLFSGEATTLTVGAEEFLEKVRLVKQKKPYLLQPELLATLFPSSICQLELLKCVIYQELMAAYDEHDTVLKGKFATLD